MNRAHRKGGPRGTLRAVTGAALTLLASAVFAVTKVNVELPVPAKINTLGVKKILVARFVAPEHASVDVGREYVRFLRRELRKGTPFQVLDVDPPALPEQTLDELTRNATFWKHIAEEYGADLIVSGRISFATADRSGFVQEDTVSPITGQKTRRSRFAEQEEYSLDASLWFFKGANGSFLYEDTFRDKQVYDGKSNDALQIFFNLTDRMTPDLLGILVPRKKQETRFIFDQ